jgi:RecA/RadA recombinase
VHKDNNNPELTPRPRRQLPTPSEIPESVRQMLERWTGGKPAIPRDQTRSALVLPVVERHPQPFGIPWLDKLLAGGLAPGEVLLFLAPTGGGKTTLATQIAWTRAMQQSHAVYLTYDQALEGDIHNRFASMVTDVPRRDLEQGSVAGMPPDIQRRFQAWREAYGNYLHLYDMSGRAQGRGDISDIETIIRDETDQDRRPSLIIVDWVQCAVGKAMGLGGRSAAEMANHMDDYARQFASICRTHRVQGVLMHQLQAKYQRARGIELDHRMAAACSTLGDHCDHALVLRRLDEDGLGIMVSSKGPGLPADRPRQVVRLNGDLNRFEAPDDIEYDKQTGGFVLKSEILTRVGAHRNALPHTQR